MRNCSSCDNVWPNWNGQKLHKSRPATNFAVVWRSGPLICVPLTSLCSASLPSANAALSDDDRFLAVFNMNPGTSLSLVDVVERANTLQANTPVILVGDFNVRGGIHTVVRARHDGSPDG